jgi:hypothetical protein
MPELTKVAVVYYSSTGTVYELANSVSRGRRTPVPTSDCSRSRSLRPEEAVASNRGWADHASATQDVPGTSHVNGQGAIPVAGTARTDAAYQGMRVATIATAIKSGLSPPNPTLPIRRLRSSDVAA